jgi:hypothetical protein
MRVAVPTCEARSRELLRIIRDHLPYRVSRSP